MENITDEEFQHLLDMDQGIGLEPFLSFDPALLSVSDGDLLCLPPLPPIEEVPPPSDIPPLEDDRSVHSIGTSVPEKQTIDEVLQLLDRQREKQEAMQLEINALKTILEKIRKYQLECLNPWIMEVTETLQKLGCMQEEPPASATDGEFNINFDRP